MVKPEELRIGNWILGKEANEYRTIDPYPMQVFSLDEHINRETDFDGGYDYAEIISGIPITPEILEKCGFEKIAGNYEKGEIVLGHKMEVLLYNGEQGESPIKLDHINSLHQLQNLYFALTGTELDYKP